MWQLRWLVSRVLVLVTLALLLAPAGCGGSDGGGPTHGACADEADCDSCEACVDGTCVAGDETPNACGTCGALPAETCGNATDDDCDGTTDEGCANPETCGNGTLDTGETCDVGATGGDRAACPTECHDGKFCTVDVLEGAGTCLAVCTYQDVLACGAADGCCPVGCSPSTDVDCSTSCGNGTLEPGETCDGDCPIACNDGVACTVDTLTGSAANCNAACAHQPLTTCVAADGCCPAGCDAALDSDCSDSCGNGTTEPDETCDGDCPSSCSDGNACTLDEATGSAENCNLACSHEGLVDCSDGDGCCPGGCNATVDDDCSISCGNGVTEPGETCDGDCPLACTDGNACTLDTQTGSVDNCNVACTHQALTECADGDGCCPDGCNHNLDEDCSASCGNGAVEEGETCDGSCPADCGDGNACTVDSKTGSAENCNLACNHLSITTCAHGDGCCPDGCNANLDDDCSVSCGNLAVEPGETCDGDCPAGCGDGTACTLDTKTGSPENCNVACSHQTITECVHGDGCCAAGCDANSDHDCSPSCGNGTTEPGETCDGDCPASCGDGNACTLDSTNGSPGNCNVTCGHQAITTCAQSDGCCPAGCDATLDDDCSPSCGNAVVEPGETCDGDCPAACKDGNACTLDGKTGSAENCNLVCSHQAITECATGDGCCPAGCDATVDDDCSPSCGNDTVEPGETCDGNCPAACSDGNACTLDARLGDADTCNVTCTANAISECVAGDGCCPAGCNANADADCSPSCGNGAVEAGETCDGNCPATCEDGNACTRDEATGSAQNCNAACTHPQISQCLHKDHCCPVGCNANLDDDCSIKCGNGVAEPGETCDGNCPATCTDGNACTVDARVGSPENCNVACSFQQITSCVHGDGCCPAGCDANLDHDCSVKCGNGVIEPGETCDGDCPKTCEDGEPCTLDTLTGSEANCNVACSHQKVVACAFGDGCCPTGCDATVDDDCSPTCGNGVVEPPQEICEGTCPLTCNDSDACTIDLMIGAPLTCNSACAFQLVSECADGDGCCPPGCSVFSDTDCDVCVGPECDAPAGWTCYAGFYDNADGCDCACGVPDPDCAIADAKLYNCEAWETCSPEGLCVPRTDCGTHATGACVGGDLYWHDACGKKEDLKEDCGGHPCSNGHCWPDVPVGWTCLPGYYDQADGCDCACGPYDPDCAIANATIYNCDPGEQCDANGLCVPRTDCASHALDKCVGGDLYWFDDCGNQEDLKEACGGHACDDGQCWPDVPIGWTCEPRYYNQVDGCDCACGPADPDCTVPDATVYNCDPGQVCSAENTCVAGCVTTTTCYKLFSAPRDVTQAAVRVTGSFSSWGDSLATGALDLFVTADGQRWERWVQLPHGQTVDYKFLVTWGTEPQQWCTVSAGAWECAPGAPNLQLAVDCKVCP